MNSSAPAVLVTDDADLATHCIEEAGKVAILRALLDLAPMGALEIHVRGELVRVGLLGERVGCKGYYLTDAGAASMRAS